MIDDKTYNRAIEERDELIEQLNDRDEVIMTNAAALRIAEAERDAAIARIAKLSDVLAAARAFLADVDEYSEGGSYGDTQDALRAAIKEADND